jgi:uncharacterized protein
MALPRSKTSRLLLGALLLLLAFQVGEVRPFGGKSTLWKVSSGKNTVYLLGSIHALKSEQYPLKAPIEQAFEDSQVLVLEVDPASMGDLAMQGAMLGKGMLPPGSTLEQCLSSSVYELAKSKTSELGLDIELFQGFKPWLFALTLGMTKLQASGFNPAQGVDFYFYGKAAAAGKPVKSLETMDYQLGLFDQLSPENQEAFLSQTLKDLDVMEKEMATLISAWSSGDVGELEALLLRNFRGHADLYEALVAQRNRAWTFKIESFLNDDKNHLVVVGAAHLVGREGLVEMLRSKGYSIEQL